MKLLTVVILSTLLISSLASLKKKKKQDYDNSLYSNEVDFAAVPENVPVYQAPEQVLAIEPIEIEQQDADVRVPNFPEHLQDEEEDIEISSVQLVPVGDIAPIPSPIQPEEPRMSTPINYVVPAPIQQDEPRMSTPIYIAQPNEDLPVVDDVPELPSEVDPASEVYPASEVDPATDVESTHDYFTEEDEEDGESSLPGGWYSIEPDTVRADSYLNNVKRFAKSHYHGSACGMAHDSMVWRLVRFERQTVAGYNYRITYETRLTEQPHSSHGTQIFMLFEDLDDNLEITGCVQVEMKADF